MLYCVLLCVCDSSSCVSVDCSSLCVCVLCDVVCSVVSVTLSLSSWYAVFCVGVIEFLIECCCLCCVMLCVLCVIVPPNLMIVGILL